MELNGTGKRNCWENCSQELYRIEAVMVRVGGIWKERKKKREGSD